MAALMPKTCPLVEVIKSAGFTGILEDKDDQLYVAYHIGPYHTPETWGFAIGVPYDQAISRVDAMNKAKAALSSLEGTPTPVAVDETQKQWYCAYHNQYDYLSVAVTPIITSAMLNHISMQTNNHSSH